MGTIIAGKRVAQKRNEKLKLEVIKLKKQQIYPTLAVILIGNDDSSLIYIKNKEKACREVGIDFQLYHLDAEVTKEETISLVIKLNNNPKIHGILIQSPIPNHINYNEITDLIFQAKDVDCFNPYNVGKLVLNEANFIPCTVLGISELFKYYDITLEGKNIVIVGRSNIVGKPLANYLINQSATVTVCHSKTKDLAQFTKKADILISATGVPHLIKVNMVKKDSVVIDVGITRKDNNLIGDVDFEKVKKKASYLTPVPGGVGPMTIAMLLNNVVKAASKEKSD